MKTFSDIYKPPFKTDDIGLYVRASNGVKAFTIAAKDPKKEADNLVELLNGTGGVKYKDVMLYGDTKIITSNASVLVTRGFGHLIGTEKLQLEDAFRVQDEFINWVMNTVCENQ
jgi:hypothetical protein